ncbi:MAG: DUF4358 domain-containing protein [Lachnospiraceae bacterium]|nr:DUF4358 domain-containing protein [Lachnospiraceae bacterium]
MVKINRKKISLVVFLMVIGILSLTACGDKEESEGKYTSKEIYDKVSASITDMPEMTVVDNTTDEGKDSFTYVTDLEQDKIKDFVFAYSKDGKADEVVVIQLKNSEDLKKVQADLEERLETRRNTFSIYDAEEGSKFQGATVVKNGNYLMLIIGNQAQNGKYAFNDMFK